MNRFTLLALGFLSLGIASSASAQTKVTQLVIQNTTGTTKLSQTSSGLDVDNKVILHNPNVITNTVTLMVPGDAGMGNANFTFPTTGGTLLTSTPNTVNGSAIINAIHATNLKINATNLDLTGITAGVSSVAAMTNALTVSPNVGDVSVDLNLGNANTWTATQTFPTTINQGNALINSINSGNIALTGYATTATLANYATLNDLTTVISGLGGVSATRTIATTAPLAGGGDLSANRTLTLNMNSTLALDGSNLTINLANNNTWTGIQTFSNSQAQGNVFVNAINNSNVALTNYVSNSSLASTLANYSTTAQMNTAISTALSSSLTVSAPLTKSGSNIGLATSGVVAGTYSLATVTVDAFGRVTSAANGLSTSNISSLISGKVNAVKTGNKVADVTVTNAAISANSLILVSCILNGTSTEEQYVASLVSQSNGSMIVRAQRNGGGVMSNGEGCTISYLIINP
jgi:hypothetical protein